MDKGVLTDGSKHQSVNQFVNKFDGLSMSFDNLQMVGELIKNTLAEEEEYKPVDGPEIGSLILIDRSKYYIKFMPLNILTIFNNFENQTRMQLS